MRHCRVLKKSVALSEVSGWKRVSTVMWVKRRGVDEPSDEPEIVNVPHPRPVYSPFSTARAARQSRSQVCVNSL